MTPPHLTRSALMLCCSLLALLPATGPALAQQAGAAAPSGIEAAIPLNPDSDQPVLLTADEIIHDQAGGIVTARGRVEVAQGERVLMADQISYNLKQDVVTAQGNITLLEPTGEVTFADRVELTGNMKQGTVENIRILLADRSRMAAQIGTRRDGVTNELKNAVYTACQPCRENPDKEPLWQVKAKQVTHDEVGKDIEYRDAWLEVAGVPVAYTPYLSHPDPSVKRRSGLLAPTAGQSKSLGYQYRQPYFGVISDQEDVTLTPILTSDEGGVLAAQHRRFFENGATRTDVSFTQDSNSDIRGHIDAGGLFHLNEVWRAGYELQRATDDTYTRRYGFRRGTDPWLTTRPFLEGFGSRSHALVEAFAFQGLRQTDDPGRNPIVLPSAMMSYVGQPGWRDSYWTMDASALALHRDEGTDTRRLGLETGWHLPFTASTGEVWTVHATLRSDAYHVANGEFDDDQKDGVSGRVVPQLAVDWRYPFHRPSQYVSQVIQPIVVGVVSPSGSNPDRIPNEDSLLPEFDDTSLFSTNRFAGWDRIETGPRVAYGLEWSAFSADGQAANALIGQGYRLTEDSGIPRGTGFDEDFSDYVGRVSYSPADLVNASYRFRLDKDSLQSRYSAATLSLGRRALAVSASYVQLESEATGSAFADQEQLSLGLSSALTRYWAVRGSTNFTMADETEPLSSALALLYEDDCLIVETNYSVDHTYDRDFQGGHSVFVRVMFKTLGELPINVF